LFSLVLLLHVAHDVLVELVEVGVLGLALLVEVLASTALDLEFVQFSALLFVVVTQTVNFLLVVCNLEQQLRVGGLPCQEPINDILHV
jgi:hypothetical protein